MHKLFNKCATFCVGLLILALMMMKLPPYKIAYTRADSLSQMEYRSFRGERT